MASPVGRQTNLAMKRCGMRVGVVLYFALATIGLLAALQVHPFAIQGLFGRVVVFVLLISTLPVACTACMKL